MKIKILKERVLESIYALSALQAYSRLPVQKQEILHEDQREGLVELVEDAFCILVIELMPRLSNYGFTEEGESDAMWIEIKERYAIDDVMVGAIEGCMAEMVKGSVLGMIFEGETVGREYSRKSSRAVTMLREIIDNPIGVPPRLAGYR